MGYPDWRKVVFTSGENVEQAKASVTSSDTSATFSQQVKSFLVYNDGNSPAHINFDAAATTNHMKIPAKAWFSIDFPVTVLHFICASGDTATVYCVGVY